MPDETQTQNQSEPELSPLVCPACSTEVFTVAEPWPEACPNCEQRFDLEAQFAFSRGTDAFTAGQELIIHIAPERREKDMTTEPEMEGVQYYIQAYTALQRAFRGKIAESQRQLGLEMMAAMSRVFLQHGMVSQLESAYWGNLLVELNTLEEVDTLGKKLAGDREGGVVGYIKRWRWRTRKNQLNKALIEVDRKITILEKNIAFVEPPRARRRSPKRS